jgi:hypothetical protein
MKHTIKSATLQSTNCVLSQSWRPDTTNRRLSHAVTTLLKYFTTWKLRLNTHKTEIILLSRPPPPNPLQNHHTLVTWAHAVRYLGLVLHSQLLYTKHLHTAANEVTGILCTIFPLLARNSTLAQSNKLTLYKSPIRSTLTYSAPVCSSTRPAISDSQLSKVSPSHQ